jgi:signal transduction histidine kinase
MVASFVGLSLALALYLSLLGVLWGSGPVLATLPLFVPTTEGFALVLALAITNLCSGRYRALREPPVLGTALAFWAYAILAAMFILSFPGLLGQGAILASMPGAAVWLYEMKWTVLAVGLLGAAVVGRHESAPSILPLLLVVVGVLALAVGLATAALQPLLPQLQEGGTATWGADLWSGLLASLFVVGAGLGLGRYLRGRNRVVGFASLVQLFGAAIMVGDVIGGQQYDLWFYLNRVLLDIGFAWMLYGIMSEYSDLYRESEGRRTLAEAMLENAPAAIALLRPPDYRLEKANPAFSALVGGAVQTGERAGELWPAMARELTPLMDRARRSGKPYQLKDVAWPLVLGPNRLPTEHHFAVSLVPLRSPSGEVDRMLLLLHDTTAEVLSLRRLQALLAVAKAGLAAPNLDPVLDALVVQSSRAMGVTMAAILLLEGESLVARKVSGIPAWPPVGVKVGEGFAGRVAAERRALHITGADGAGLEIAPALREQGLRSMLGVPILVGERLMGVFLVGHREEHQFDPDEVQFVSTLADLFAAALENARLYSEVQETLQLREEFLRDSAHELRTPVTSIKGYAQLLVRLVPEQETRLRQMVEELDHQAERLARLVQDLLEVAEFQAGHPDLHLERFDLSKLVRQVVAGVKAEKGPRVVPREVVPAIVEADRARLQRVLEDLLQVALRSAPAGTDVDVELVLHEGDVQIAVRDRAVTIPPERQPHLFEPFYPIWAPGEEGYTPSRGVGLYIDRAIVEAHGGDMWFESQEGKGMAFHVRLPLAT